MEVDDEANGHIPEKRKVVKSGSQESVRTGGGGKRADLKPNDARRKEGRKEKAERIEKKEREENA